MVCFPVPDGMLDFFVAQVVFYRVVSESDQFIVGREPERNDLLYGQTGVEQLSCEGKIAQVFLCPDSAVLHCEREPPDLQKTDQGRYRYQYEHDGRQGDPGENIDNGEHNDCQYNAEHHKVEQRHIPGVVLEILLFHIMIVLFCI